MKLLIRENEDKYRLLQCNPGLVAALGSLVERLTGFCQRKGVALSGVSAGAMTVSDDRYIQVRLSAGRAS